MTACSRRAFSINGRSMGRYSTLHERSRGRHASACTKHRRNRTVTVAGPYLGENFSTYMMFSSVVTSIHASSPCSSIAGSSLLQQRKQQHEQARTDLARQASERPRLHGCSHNVHVLCIPAFAPQRKHTGQHHHSKRERPSVRGTYAGRSSPTPRMTPQRYTDLSFSTKPLVSSIMWLHCTVYAGNTGSAPAHAPSQRWKKRTRHVRRRRWCSLSS